MTLTEKKIQRMVKQHQYISAILNHTDKDPTEQMTQLYYFLRDQMEDVERINRDEAIAARNRLNGYPSKAGH